MKRNKFCVKVVNHLCLKKIPAQYLGFFSLCLITVRCASGLSNHPRDWDW